MPPRRGGEQVAAENSTLEWAWKYATPSFMQAGGAVAEPSPLAAVRVEGGGGAVASLLLLVVYGCWCAGTAFGWLRDKRDMGRRRVAPDLDPSKLEAGQAEVDDAYRRDAEIAVYTEAAAQYAAAAKVYAGLFGDDCEQVHDAHQRRAEALKRARARPKLPPGTADSEAATDPSRADPGCRGYGGR